MSNIIPIFKSNASLGRSILPAEKPSDKQSKKDYLPIVSIYDIVKNYALKDVCIFDDSFLSFPSIYKDFRDLAKVIYGINYVVCQDVKDRSDESRKTESKITVYMKNSNGYRDILNFNNEICGKEENFYYQPRVDWKMMNRLWTDNLGLVIPAYDNFLHNNLFSNFNCIPDFGKIKPVFLYANMNLPFDSFLSNEIKKYATSNNFESNECHYVYYYSRDDYEAYMNFRCIDNRSKFSDPRLEYFSSDEFCWESYCNKIGIEFKNI